MGEGKVTDVYDFRKVPVPEKLLEIPLDMQKVREKLEEVPEKFLTIEEATDAVCPGDIVTITLPEETVQMNVGKHFYDAVWEDTLVGMKPGNEVTLPARGANQTGRLTQIKRRIYPPLTDELIVKLGLEGISTIGEYQAYIEERMIGMSRYQKEGALVQYVSKKVVEQSGFEDMEEGLDAIGEILAAQAGKTFNQENYEARKQEYLAMGADPRQMEQMYTYEYYVREEKYRCLQNLILEYYSEKFKVVRK